MNLPSICFVCANIYPVMVNRPDLPVVGGEEVQVLLISQGLRQHGFQVSLVGEDFGQGREATVNGFRFLSFRLRRNKLAQAVDLLQALRRAQADVYYVAGIPRYGFLIYLFCRVTRRKIVQALSSDVEAAPVKGDPRAMGWTFRLHTAWRQRADLVLAQTKFQAERLRTRWGLAARIMPHVITLNDQAPQTQWPTGKFRVLWVARLNPVKRVEWLIDIAQRAPDIQFAVIGGQALKSRSYALQMSPLLKACPNVNWLGYVPYNQVDAWFRSAQVLLHTSAPGTEGFPMVFVQAWAAGIPVVSTGSNPDDLLTTGGLGYCLPTVDEVVAALQALAADPDRARAMGARARQHVWDNHRPEVVLPQFAQCFQGLWEAV
jgi:glycosyltransferase involved in cell wall biosynthesis